MDEESVSIEYIQELIRDLAEERDELSKKENSDFISGVAFEIDEILLRLKASLSEYDSISEMEELRSIS